MTAEGTGYWSERSERVTTMSWALIAEVPKEVRRRWGRWSPSVDEEYAVTTKKVVLAAQGGVAHKTKGNHKTSDVLDDKSVINNYIRWLQENFDKTLEEATSMAMPLTPPMWPGRESGGLVLKPGPGAERVESTPPATPTSRPASPTEVISDAEEEPDHKPESLYPKGTYVLSVVGRPRRRTLHRIGECFRIPRVHYHNYVVVGQERPEIRAEEGEKLCGVCFGVKAKMAEILLQGEGKDDDPSSESSSSVMEASESEA